MHNPCCIRVQDVVSRLKTISLVWILRCYVRHGRVCVGLPRAFVLEVNNLFIIPTIFDESPDFAGLSASSMALKFKPVAYWHRAMAWLRAGPASISTLRAVALLLRAIRATSPPSDGTPGCLSADACIPVMALLESNLASESRLLRLSTMRVLVRYDPLVFEEDHGGGGSNKSRGQGECNVFEVAEAVEALPISVAAERDLMWRLGQLEVLGRSGRLPRPYARVMATHALGLLRVKFSGVWPRAAAIITALYQRFHQREAVWEPVQVALRNVMPPPATRQQVAAVMALGEEQSTPGSGTVSKEEAAAEVAPSAKGLETGDNNNDVEVSTPPKLLLEQQQQGAGLRVAVPPPQPWVPRLLSHAAVLDRGPTQEMDLPVALQGVFRDESVRRGLQPESGEVPLWSSTDSDSAFAQVREPAMKLQVFVRPFCFFRGPCRRVLASRISDSDTSRLIETVLLLLTWRRHTFVFPNT